MIRTIAWLLAAGLFAISAHIVYVMFIPRQEMSRVIGESASLGGMNKFAVLDGDQQQRILNESGRTAIAGLCPFDLSQGELVFEAALPEAMWSFTVYAESGKDAYAINETQAGTNRFQLTIKPTPGFFRLLLGEGTDLSAIGDGWTVETPSRRGIAIVWVSLDDARLRGSYSEAMSKSSCRVQAES